MRRITRKAFACLVALVLVGGTSACDTDALLEVNDPDLVTPDNITGQRGAELVWAGAIGDFATSYSSGGGGQALYVGMITDEYHLSGTFPTRNQVDRREIDNRNGTMLGEYRSLHHARVSLARAAAQLREFLPGDPRIAEVLSLQGFTYLMFGENYCSGVPFGTVEADGTLKQGEQLSTTETLEVALGLFNEALGETGGDATQQNLAAIGKGRTLLDLGRYAEAAAAVAGVPTDFVYWVRSKDGGTFNQRNAIWELNGSQRRWSVSDGEGGTGLTFRTAGDPRVPVLIDAGIGFDEETPLHLQQKYPSWESDTDLATGIEARLIEAEAALQAGDPAGMLTILNDLRADEGMAALTDPGTQDGRVDLLFDERAFWLFSTAHRLGDMRRLIRQYGRTEDQVFPTGAYFKGGNYGDDVNFPIPFEENENPNFTGCFDRGA
ncbi:MAG: hypothetical protein D6701_06645 [Gemmatimonadetes bacterium]|nr:MAG: hypothetical protein D6701_06645 [Gemmatimonadota bacterium]